MTPKKILVIICVTAGSQDAVSTEIRDILDENSVRYRIIKVNSPPEIERAIKKVRFKNYEIAALYGGDGTIIAGLKALGQSQLPVLILPGGTANALAKYYSLPNSVADCLNLYISNVYVHERVDIATVNGDPLILDIHMGLWTDAIKSTPRKLKKRVGEAAYAWSALLKAPKADMQTYKFALNNGAARTVQGYTFIIANQGNHNILGVPLFAYDHAPGMVQTAIIKSIKPRELVAWFICRMFGKNLDSVIEVHRAKSLVITKAPKSVLSDDDSKKISYPATISGGQLAVGILIPPTKTDTSASKKIFRRFRLRTHRLTQRIKIFTTGSPSLRSSHVAPGLYLGGKYSPKSYKIFESWGITGIVSMRQHSSPPAPRGVELLSLPTTDWHPPTLKALEKGVTFIRKHIADGGSVYVHCQLGEGRGPTMAAAYLITKGFSVDEAIALLVKYRPVVQPNEAQRKRLAEWQEHYNNKMTS